METFIGTVLALIQLVVAGFVAWGGWLAFGEWLRQRAGTRQARANERKADDFERVASLVLLALLCTTLMAA
jgi:hypothetical protein